MSLNNQYLASQVTAFKNASSSNVNSDLSHSNAKVPKVLPGLTDKPLSAVSQLKLITSETAVTCSWQYVQYATGYILERADDSNFTQNRVTIYNGGGNAFVDTTIKYGTTYYYRVTTTAPGYYGDSKDNFITTLNQIPAGTLTLSDINDTRITISWLPISGATGYVVEKSLSSTFASGVSTVYTGDDLTVNATGLTDDSHYYFRIHGTEDNHTAQNYAYADETTLASLEAPTLTFGTVGATQIIINWTAVTGATSYGLERSPNGSSSWTPIFTGAGLTYTNTDLTASTAYYYRVHAIASNHLAITYGSDNTTTTS